MQRPSADQLAYTQPQLYINGQWLGIDGRQAEDVINPATGAVLARLPHATPADLDAALTAAQRALRLARGSAAGALAHPARRRCVAARARRRHRPRHDAGAGQAAARGAPGGAGRRRHLRLVRRGRPAQLRPRGARAPPAPAHHRAARARGRVRGVHALELPGHHPGAQDRRGPGRRLHADHQAGRGNPGHRPGPGARAARRGPACGRAERRVRRAGRGFILPAGQPHRRQVLLHRLHGRGQAAGAAGGQGIEARHPGAGRPRAGHRLRRRRGGARGRPAHRRQVPQRRPGVHRPHTHLCAGAGLRGLRARLPGARTPS